MKQNKLVRDKISEIIKKHGKTPVTHIASDREYWEKLKEKLTEEAKEFMEDSNKDEIVDLLEIIYAICDFRKIKKSEIEKLRKNKARERGAFRKKIILDEIK